MRPMFAVSAGVTLLLLASGTGWAAGRNRSITQNVDSAKVKETPPAFNKTFQWEEKELGPKDKGVDHDESPPCRSRGVARTRPSARSRPPAATPRRPARTASPAPRPRRCPPWTSRSPEPAGSVRQPGVRKASYTPPKRRRTRSTTSSPRTASANRPPHPMAWAASWGAPLTRWPTPPSTPSAPSAPGTALGCAIEGGEAGGGHGLAVTLLLLARPPLHLLGSGVAMARPGEQVVERRGNLLFRCTTKRC